MNDIRIDSHKLIYHTKAVTRWLNGESIYPIELEISPSGSCNHRCTFCAVDYMGYQAVKLDKKRLLDNLKEIQPKGLKSVIYAGEGEPLLHEEIAEIVNQTKFFGIDTAISSNGVLLTSELAEEMLSSLSWIRFSISAAKEETYKKIHQCKTGDLKKVLDNLQSTVDMKKRKKLSTTLGAQLLLIEDNKEEVLELAKMLKEIGLDYFTIKPFSYHPKSGHQMTIDYERLLQLEKDLENLETNEYKIYFRAHSMKKLQQERCYTQCYGLPFMSYLDSRGNLWPCVVVMGDHSLSYGNIYNSSFREIWEGKKRKEILEIFNKIDLKKNCRELCRLDEINRYLYALKNPNEHVNFI